MNKLTDKELFNKKRFNLFLELIGLRETSRNAYTTTLLNCSDFIKDELNQSGYASLYEVEDQNEIKRFQQILEMNQDYIIRNHTGNNKYSASMVNYVKFLDFLFIFG